MKILRRNSRLRRVARLQGGLRRCLATVLCIATPFSYGIDIHHIQIAGGPDEYMVGLLKLGLSYSETNYNFVENTEILSRSRAQEYVKNNKLSVIWGGTSLAMEENFLPVRIPGFKGLLGYRLFIIREDAQSRFRGVRTLEDLKRFKFGQGRTWSDTSILENAGLEVVKAKATNNLLFMTDGGRFDAFPRGAHEPWSELQRFPELELTVEKELMLVYKLAYYFFVNTDNRRLAQEITDGLNKAIADGSFDQYFYRSPMVADVLKQANLSKRRAIHINNPILPSKTPVDRAELWFDPEKIIDP